MVRFLSPSRLKKLLAPFSLTTYTYARPVSNSHHSLTFAPSSHSSQSPAKTPSFILLTAPFSSEPVKNQTLPLTRDGNYEEANEGEPFPICPGCGVHMQDFDHKQPGFFLNPAIEGPYGKRLKEETPVTDDPEIEDRVFDEMPKKVENLGSPDEKNEASEKPTVCSRCHNLRHHGKVAHPSVENLLPDFDFGHTVGKRMMTISGGRTVVLVVAEATDFDGSFPKSVVDLVSKTMDENAQSWEEGKPKLLLVVTKIDLLPSNVSPTWLENWFKTRAREVDAGKLTGLHLVSAVRKWGIKTLVDDVVKFAGETGNVWAVGAQNAGKSALINAIGKCVGSKVTLTEAPVPGTTLGILRLEGVLPGRAKLFDTPGLLLPHQMSTRLTSNEHKLIRIRKELKPRTYRIEAGHSVHIGGLLRLDIEESSVESIYVTVWASPLLPLHMGKRESTGATLDKHFGRKLKPPIGNGRFHEVGEWVKREFRVTGNWWDSSAVDIAAAGLGWFAIGLKGEALLSVWTYEGVDVILRNALLPQRSHSFEVAGFAVSEVVSKADQAKSKKPKNEKKSKQKGESSSASSYIGRR